MMIIITLSMCILTLANLFHFLRLHRAPSSFSIDRYKKLQCLFFAFQLRLSILSGSRFIWLVWILLCESVWRVALFFSRASRFSLVCVYAHRAHTMYCSVDQSHSFIVLIGWLFVFICFIFLQFERCWNSGILLLLFAFARADVQLSRRKRLARVWIDRTISILWRNLCIRSEASFQLAVECS